MSFTSEKKDSLNLEQEIAEDRGSNPERYLYAAVIERLILDYKLDATRLAMAKFGKSEHQQKLIIKSNRAKLRKIEEYVFSDESHILSFSWTSQAVSENRHIELMKKVRNKIYEIRKTLLHETELEIYS